MKIKRYLGFTDDIKEPLKTKAENTLDKPYRYKGQILNCASLACTRLLEGYTAEKEENYSYYKKNGEMSKPKTLYKFMDKDRSYYFEISKTEYDFVSYLIMKGLDTEEKILAYDKADVEKIENETRLKAEEKQRKIDEEYRRKEELEEFKSWMYKEADNIPDWQKKTVDEIFLNIYGMEVNKRNYTLVVCINHFDNPFCKDEIKQRLNNDNKASIKVFECLTGLKLPSTYKKRIEYLESITSKDFKEPVAYKPRKKAEHKDIELQKFYILQEDNADAVYSWSWKMVLGEPFEKYGYKMFIRNNTVRGLYECSLAENGALLASGKTKTECMNKLKEIFNKYSKEKISETIDNFTQMAVSKAGCNPLLNNQ